MQLLRASFRALGFLCLLAPLLAATPALARDVAFMESGGSSSTPDEAFKIEPKSELDIGDSILNIVRRQSLFFVNQTSQPVHVEKMAISSDSTVTPLIVNDDCSKQSVLPPMSRCSIELSITPTGPGSWGIELLMTHNGPGRITRAKITGKTAGSDANERKERGLFLTTKDSKPIEFGDVKVGAGKVVRSALMVNDSPSDITIYSIDVIEADPSLKRLDDGCAVDMELKPGESCPVTMVWTPTGNSVISTDLIIRHSGQLGFAVVPVRGTAKSDENNTIAGGNSVSGGAIAPPPSPAAVATAAAEQAMPVPSRSLSAASGMLHLIGTVGNRAVFLKPDGSSAIVQAGESIDLGRMGIAKVVSIGGTTASLVLAGQKRDYTLEAVQELKERALATHKTTDFALGSGSLSGQTGGAGVPR